MCSKPVKSSRYRLLVGADDEVAEWVCARTPNPQPWVKGLGTAIGFTRGDKLIAGVTYSLFNGVNVWFGMASEDHRWFNRANLWAIFHYPFSQLKVQRLSALIDAGNSRSIRLAEHLGFSREATLVNSAPDGDQHIYRLFASECRWLNDLRWHPVSKREAA